MNYIATADWHLRKKVPACRTETEEEWIDYQFEIVNSIFSYALEYNAVLCIAGDIFHRSVPSTIILHKTIVAFKKFIDSGGKLCMIPGNHDLPYHNYGMLNQSGYGVLEETIPVYSNIGRHPFGVEEITPGEIMLCHHLVFKKNECPPNVDAKITEDVCKLYPDSKYIICGDNHTGFMDTYKEQLLIVPGCITIQSASGLDYSPVFYHLVKDNIYRIKLLNNTENLNIDYLEKIKSRDSRVDNFVESLRTGKKISLSFKENLKTALQQKTILQNVKNIIIEIEEEL